MRRVGVISIGKCGALALLVGSFIALALPGIARAHHPPLLYQGVTSTTAPRSTARSTGRVVGCSVLSRDLRSPIGDGEVQARRPIPLCRPHRDRPRRRRKGSSFFFDDDHNGLLDQGEDSIRRLSPATPAATSSTTRTAPKAPATTTTSTTSARTTSSRHGRRTGLLRLVVTFELRHPLCPVDDTHDFCLAEGTRSASCSSTSRGRRTSSIPGSEPARPERLGRPHDLREPPPAPAASSSRRPATATTRSTGWTATARRPRG